MTAEYLTQRAEQYAKLLSSTDEADVKLLHEGAEKHFYDE